MMIRLTARPFALLCSFAALATSLRAQVTDTARVASDAARADSSASSPLSKFWPAVIPGPPAREGAILPHKRVVAFYGTPRSTRMGILGQIPPAEMFKRLEAQAAAYTKADPSTPAQPALELIATVAQADPGRDGMYRARMSDSTLERVYQWAHERGWILVLDIQIGRSTVAKEIEVYRKFLERPDVHLALDPEFAMRGDQVPGKKIGTLDANDINYASAWLARIVEEKQLPPKILVVHRFTRPMVTNHTSIVLDPRVQVVMHMDGFGPPQMKLASHKAYIEKEPVQWVGFKLFYKNDKPIMTPAQVVGIKPAPLFISYQ
jgi:hypothetical protein